MTGGTSVDRKEAGEEVREFTKELFGEKCETNYWNNFLCSPT